MPTPGARPPRTEIDPASLARPYASEGAWVLFHNRPLFMVSAMAIERLLVDKLAGKIAELMNGAELSTLDIYRK
jgi:hypothetical protein